MNGFKTDVDEMLDGRNGWTTEAIITVGDTLPGGYTFEAKEAADAEAPSVLPAHASLPRQLLQPPWLAAHRPPRR